MLLPLFLHDPSILCLPAVGIVRVGLNEILPRLGATSQELLQLGVSSDVGATD